MLLEEEALRLLVSHTLPVFPPQLSPVPFFYFKTPDLFTMLISGFSHAVVVYYSSVDFREAVCVYWRGCSWLWQKGEWVPLCVTFRSVWRSVCLEQKEWKLCVCFQLSCGCDCGRLQDFALSPLTESDNMIICLLFVRLHTHRGSGQQLVVPCLMLHTRHAVGWLISLNVLLV